ncbi:MAG: hypothetical protein WAO52_08410 [Prolixibacteraceae bacterium]
MRSVMLVLGMLMVAQSYSQPFRKYLISGIVVNPDTVPVSEAAIINIRTGKTIRTNFSGFFQTEITEDDSLFVYHIAYKNKFIRLHDHGKLIFLEPEIQELMQVDITAKAVQERKNLQQTISEIKQLAPNEKLTGFDLKSEQEYFIEQHGTHDNVIRPFFGPTFHVPLEIFLGVMFQTEEQKELKRKTSHYNLTKKKE